MAIDTPLRKLFDYLPPAGTDLESLQVGTRLRVPFGRQTVLGILTEVANHSEVPANKLRCALEILDTEPVLDAACFELVRWAAQYYHHPIGEAHGMAPIPGQVRRMRIQQRLKTGGAFEEDVSKREYSSAVPFLPPLARGPPTARAQAALGSPRDT